MYWPTGYFEKELVRRTAMDKWREVGHGAAAHSAEDGLGLAWWVGVVRGGRGFVGVACTEAFAVDPSSDSKEQKMKVSDIIFI